MNILKVIGGIILVILISLICILTYFNGTRGIHITINNNTNEDLDGLYFSYQYITEDIKVPMISNNDTIKVNIIPKEEFSENVLVMYYYDNNGNKHQDIVIGYFEKGYNMKIDLDIKLIDKNGVLDIEVQSNLLY